MILTTERHKLTDIAEVERARNGIIYPAGTIYIQVSATQGYIEILQKPGPIETKYATIIPKIEISAAYFKIALERCAPEFLARYKSTINIQMGDFQFFEVDIHPDKKTQHEIVAIMNQCEIAEKAEADIVDTLKECKRIALAKMMC